MEWAWVVAALLLALVLYHTVRLRQLIRWLEGDDPDPPRARGTWDRLHATLFKARRDAANRQRELEAGLDRWREAARALPDGVVILDSGRIQWCNDIARLHLQIDLGQDAGRPFTHLVRIPAFAEYLEGGDFSKPIQVVSPHAGERVLSLQVVPYGESQSLVLSRDITQFQQVERVRREFVANVSHELRTPLTVISGFVETLRDETDPASTRRFLDLMGEQAGRMERLVEDLLTLSALESSPLPPMEEVVDMVSMAERMAAEARALSGSPSASGTSKHDGVGAEGRGEGGRHHIVVDAEPGLDLLGSDKELASAFGNLVSNAIRYTPEGGQVTLRWKRLVEGAAFEVSDTGIGIAAEHIPRLTERFYRVDRGRSRETGGTGLGLAIVKHALGRHGAALAVSSQPGQGSTFSARFSGPRLRPALSQDKPPA